MMSHILNGSIFQKLAVQARYFSKMSLVSIQKMSLESFW